MKSLAQVTEELIKDAEKACKNKGYLKRLLRSYFETMPAEDRRAVHQELVKDQP